MLEWIVLYLLYFFAGFTLKFGDNLLDEMNKPNQAWIVLALAGIFFAVIITNSEYDMVLLTAIIIGVLLSGKVNHKQFSIGFLIIGLGFVIWSIPPVTDWLEWLAILILLLLAAILDEKGNDWTDKAMNPTAATLFKYRFSLKITVLLISIIWPLFVIAAIGLWIFDAGYESAGLVTQNID